MKILTVLHSRGLGGGLQKMAAEIHNSLDNHERFIYSLYSSEVNEHFDGNLHEEHEVLSHSSFSNIGKLFSRAYKIAAYTRANGIDCTISHGDEVNFSVLLAKFFFLRGKIITVCHQDLSIYKNNTIYRFLFFLLFRFSNISVLVSQTMREDFLSLTHQTNFVVIQNGVALNTSNKEYSLDKKLHLLPDNFFLAIGRLTQKKGWHALLPSFAKLVRYDSTQHLVILGEGELFSEMEEYIKKHSLSSNIHLLGIQKNTAFFYEHATTFVLPSLAETLGLVFLEALSFGVPIIAADIPALRLIHQVDEKENLQFPHKTEYGYLVSGNNSSVFLSPEEISEDESLYLALVEGIKVSFSPDVLRSRAEQFDIKRTIFLWKKLIKSYE